MAIRVFFVYNKTLIQLPVNPEELKIVSSGNNTTIEIVKLGEVSRLRTPKLRECEITSFLPVNKNAPYVLTKGKFKTPQYYIDLFTKVMNAKKPMRFLVSDTKINMLVSVEKFEYWLAAQDDDTHFTIALKEYEPYQVKELKVVKKKVTKKSSSSKARQKTGLSIGDRVVANGKYFYDSYGSDPHGTFKNFDGKISHIVADKKRPYRYHITTLTGGYRGWVKPSQIKHK